MTDPSPRSMARDRWRWLPNALTFLRILLVAPFALALYREQYLFALGLFLVASVTDALDGFLARVFGWRSRVGAIADPLADKLLLVTAWLMFALTGLIPWWLFVLVLSRDLIIVVGGVLFHRMISQFDVTPTVFGKLNTLIQILGALVIMLSQAGLVLPPETLDTVVILVAIVALISGGDYVWVWGRKAWRSRNQ